MKRSTAGEQTLGMNHTDFERAAGGRKIKFNFSGLVIDNGRIDYNSKYAPLAKDLVIVLQENEQTRKLLQKQVFEFTMTTEYKLIIKNNTAPVSSEETDDKQDADTSDDLEKEPEESPSTNSSKISDGN